NRARRSDGLSFDPRLADRPRDRARRADGAIAAGSEPCRRVGAPHPDCCRYGDRSALGGREDRRSYHGPLSADAADARADGHGAGAHRGNAGGGRPRIARQGGLMTALRLILVLLIAVLARPTAAIEPEQREVTVISARVWEGHEYRETFAPSTHRDFVLMA